VETDAPDRGFSLVELLIVIVVLGIVGTVTTLSVRGITDKGSDSVCGYDRRVMSEAIEVYLGEHAAGVIPGATAPDRMQALIDAGLLRDPSLHYQVEADGSLTPIGICTSG
jgi:prepilin-type N-terminal cleavage/methylation domain-containing protein